MKSILAFIIIAYSSITFGADGLGFKCAGTNINISGLLVGEEGDGILFVLNERNALSGVIKTRVEKVD